MADLSTAKKGDITIDKNVAYNLVEQSTGRMGEGRSGGGGGHQEYDVVGASESQLPSQVSGESSFRR